MSYFKVIRGWQDSAVWEDEPYSQREAWLWMVGEANFKDKKIPIQGKPFILKRGSFRSSIRFMADKFQWSTNRVLRFLDKLKNWSMVETHTETGQIIITICNYNKYQGRGDSSGDTNGNTTGDSSGDTSGDKLEEGQEGKEVINKKPPAKISLEQLSVDHVADWLAKKRGQGKFMNIDEGALLEKFKDYCRSTGKPYKDFPAAFRNSFDWNNAPKKGQTHETPIRNPTKSERLRIAGQRALDELNAATDAKHEPGEKLAIAGPADPEL